MGICSRLPGPVPDPVKAGLAALRAERDRYKQLAAMMLARTYAGEMTFTVAEIEVRGDLKAWDVILDRQQYGALAVRVVPRVREG